MTAQLLDLGPSDVHIPGGSPGAPRDYQPTRTPTDLSQLQPQVTPMSELDAAARKKIPSGQFADPAERKYPVDTKARADNAAARLEQQKSSMSTGKYARIKARIKAAQKRFGEGGSDKPKKARMRGRGLRMITTHPDGTRIEVRHMTDDEPVTCFLPAVDVSGAIG